MPKKWTKKEAFAKLGAVCVNDRWSWSGRSADEKTVVTIFWQDEFYTKEKRIFYARRGIDPDNPDARLGIAEMMENLMLACERCDSIFKVVVAIPKIGKSGKKEIKECFPSDMVMRLLYLDIDRAAFVAECV